MTEIKPGRVIFTRTFRTKQGKTASNTIDPKWQACLVLGHEEDHIWTKQRLDQILMNMGLAYSSDLLECFGEEGLEKFKKFCEAKYLPPKKSSLHLPDEPKIVKPS